MRPRLFAKVLPLLLLGLLGQPAAAQDTAKEKGAQEVAALAALGPVPRGRLGDAVVPAAYRIDLSIDPDAEEYSGHTQIDVTLAAPARFIDLHGLNLEMRQASAVIAGVTYPGRWTQVDDTGVARLVFDRELPAGPATLDFTYAHPFNQGPAGIFRVKVGDRWFAWTQFESIDARQAFPGFDQPGFKVPFTVTLRTRPGQAAVSNTPEMSSSLEDGWQVHRFATTKPLPTYLLAFMVGPFAMTEGQIGPSQVRKSPIPLRVVTTPENAGNTGFALEATRQIVPLLENYFGIPYPFEKLDQITSPIMPGAMENAGAVLYGDTNIILGEDATTARKRRAGMVMAHELGHQWFGDLVTPKWWDDIWLNESFANWVGYHIADKWRPDLHVGDGALDEGFAAMDTDALIAGRAIRQPIDANGQIDAVFDSITYGKGGQVIAMIAAFMGEEKFRDGVRHHLAAHAYGNATGEDFYAALAAAAGDPRIVTAMKGFVEQQGVPLITVSGQDGTYTVSQSRYARLGTTAPDTHWTVPLCMSRGDARDCLLLDRQSATIALPGNGPVLPNAGGTGYYRFELPAAQWDALIAKADTLKSGEAQALADSLRASFLAGRAAPGQLIALAQSLADNPDSYALDQSIDTLALLDKGEIMKQGADEAYRKLTAKIYGPKLAALGFDPALGVYDGTDPQVSARRMKLVSVLAFKARDPATRKLLSRSASAYLQGDAKALDPAFMAPAFAVYVNENGLPQVKDLANRALATQDPVLRPALIGALAKQGDIAAATWLLDGLRDDRLRATERLHLVSGVIDEPQTREFAAQWLDRHYADLAKEYGGIFITTSLPEMFSDFCSLDSARRIERQFSGRVAGTPGELPFARVMEEIRDCAVLTAARGKQSREAVIAAAR